MRLSRDRLLEIDVRFRKNGKTVRLVSMNIMDLTVKLTELELHTIAHLLLSAEDRAWKTARNPEDLDETRRLRVLIKKLPLKGLIASVVRQHCKLKPIPY